MELGRRRRGRGGRHGVPPGAGPRLLRHGLHRRGPRRAGQGAAARRRPGDPAASDQRRLMAEQATPAPSVVAAAPLPETAAVHWRPPMDAARLRRRGALWTLTTAAHVVPFLAAGVVLFLVQPLAVAVSLASFAHAWVIPMLYAARGANVLRPRDRLGAGAEHTALGLLGDLVGHDARDLHDRTGLVVERGRLGVWLVGEAG